MDDETYPITNVERKAIHDDRHEAEDVMKATVPAEHWDTVWALARAHRRQAAFYGYLCADDDELREYIDLEPREKS